MVSIPSVGVSSWYVEWFNDLTGSCVGDFVKTRWYSRVFVDGLGGVNPDACRR